METGQGLQKLLRLWPNQSEERELLRQSVVKATPSITGAEFDPWSGAKIP